MWIRGIIFKPRSVSAPQQKSSGSKRSSFIQLLLRQVFPQSINIKWDMMRYLTVTWFLSRFGSVRFASALRFISCMMLFIMQFAATITTTTTRPYPNSKIRRYSCRQMALALVKPQTPPKRGKHVPCLRTCVLESCRMWAYSSSAVEFLSSHR